MTKHSVTVRFVATALLVALTAPAWAWGPKAQVAIVTSAARIISKQNNIALVRLEDYIQRGASASAEEVAALAPQFESDPLQAIEHQMYLLQGVRDAKRLDPYYAYRLGVLGKMVAEYTSPMSGTDSSVRDLYFADVEKNIGNVSLKPSPRRKVDARIYLEGARSDAQGRRDLVVSDYEAGSGFGGVARNALTEEASRSVNAVADIWFTILSSEQSVGGISDEQRREYFLLTMDFHLKRKNPNIGEVNNAYEKLQEMGELTADLRKRIGDMYFDAGQFQRAMAEYKAVIELEPGRDDVAQRMAEYYASVGAKALEANDLEASLEAYNQAQQANPTSAEVQQQRREAENRLNQRNAQLESARQALQQAMTLQQQAEQEQARRNYGEAIDALQQARALYAGVPPEFPVESQEAARGVAQVDGRISEVKRLLVTDTDDLSGSALSIEARRLAGQNQDLSSQALEQILSKGYEAQLQQMRRSLDERLSATP